MLDDVPAPPLLHWIANLQSICSANVSETWNVTNIGLGIVGDPLNRIVVLALHLLHQFPNLLDAHACRGTLR